MQAGSIVNVASVSGIKPFAGASAYGASKAAIRLLSRIAAIECADARNGVRVNVVSPGGVKTPMWETMDFFRALVAEHGGAEEASAAMDRGHTSCSRGDRPFAEVQQPDRGRSPPPGWSWTGPAQGPGRSVSPRSRRLGRGASLDRP
jgi:NAD(P)-dependent dehydrogenase (short-subunit alcohol dehydrogenase family)